MKTPQPKPAKSSQTRPKPPREAEPAEEKGKLRRQVAEVARRPKPFPAED